MAFEDLGAAASLFRPTWEGTSGVDYVSTEVPPDLAYDTPATATLARRLDDKAGFPNLLVKIHGTSEGLMAMEETVAAGIGVNVTLLFSDAQYLQTDALLEADYTGAEAEVAAEASAGLDVDALAESLQRQGARAFSADWAAPIEALGAKVAGM